MTQNDYVRPAQIKDVQLSGEFTMMGHQVKFIGSPLERIVNVIPAGTEFLVAIRQQGIYENDGVRVLMGEPTLMWNKGQAVGFAAIDAFVNAFSLSQMIVVGIDTLFTEPDQFVAELTAMLQQAGVEFDRIVEQQEEPQPRLVL